MAQKYSTKEQNWLKSDVVSQTQKSAVDLDKESQLAQMLHDRNVFQRQNERELSQHEKGLPRRFERVAEGYGSRGLLQSGMYAQADDRAFQDAQFERTGIESALADYLNNYDVQLREAGAAAEAEKRRIDAEALQRYASELISGVGVGGKK